MSTHDVRTNANVSRLVLDDLRERACIECESTGQNVNIMAYGCE